MMKQPALTPAFPASFSPLPHPLSNVEYVHPFFKPSFNTSDICKVPRASHSLLRQLNTFFLLSNLGFFALSGVCIFIGIILLCSMCIYSHPFLHYRVFSTTPATSTSTSTISKIHKTKTPLRLLRLRVHYLRLRLRLLLLQLQFYFEYWFEFFLRFFLELFLVLFPELCLFCLNFNFNF